MIKLNDAFYLIDLSNSHRHELIGSGQIRHVTKMEVFFAISKKLDPGHIWKVFRKAYTDSDDLFIWKYDILNFLTNGHGKLRSSMTAAELRLFNTLPEKILIYRGMDSAELESGIFGISWTLERSVAEFFAHKYARNSNSRYSKKLVHCLEIDKNDIEAIFLHRDEKEVIYVPKSSAAIFQF